MPRNIDAYISEIQSAIEDIQSYIKGLDFESYLSEGKTKDAVERRLITAGEALSQMSKMDMNLDQKNFRFSQNCGISEYSGPRVLWYRRQNSVGYTQL